MPEALTIQTTIKSSGKTLDTLQDQLDSLERGIGPKLIQVAVAAQSFMSKYIDSKRKRPKIKDKARLASAFKTGNLSYDSEGVNGVIQLGIGDIALLDAQFPYWRMLNYGGAITIHTPTGGTTGWFGHKERPEEGSDGKDLFHFRPYNASLTQKGAEQNAFLMIPKKAITGIKYLEATNTFISMSWGRVWDDYVKQIQTTTPTTKRLRRPRASAKSIINTVTDDYAAGLSASDRAKLSM